MIASEPELEPQTKIELKGDSNTSSPNHILKPDPPSLEEELASASESQTSARDKNEEDEMVAQARAIALSAAMLNNKSKRGLNKGLNPFSINIAGVVEKEELPLGDLQQRKLIEAKLGEKLKQQQQQPDPPSNPLNAVAGLVEVKGKIDGFIKEQQQKIEETWSQRDLKSSISPSLPSSPTRSQSSGFDISSARSIPNLDNKDANHTTSVSTKTGTNISARAESDAPVKLSSIVWKRRSG